MCEVKMTHIRINLIRERHGRIVVVSLILFPLPNLLWLIRR
jgi:hypothetical protein